MAPPPGSHVLYRSSVGLQSVIVVFPDRTCLHEKILFKTIRSI